MMCYIKHMVAGGAESLLDGPTIFKMRQELVGQNVQEAFNNGLSIKIEELYDAVIVKKSFEVRRQY